MPQARQVALLLGLALATSLAQEGKLGTSALRHCLTQTCLAPKPAARHSPSVSPPPLFAAPWTGKLSDFSQGVQGWDGTETTSGCGRFGVILGGHNALGSGQSVTKKFTGLPSHNAVRVQLR